jgi:hypothetical protein
MRHSCVRLCRSVKARKKRAFKLNSELFYLPFSNPSQVQALARRRLSLGLDHRRWFLTGFDASQLRMRISADRDAAHIIYFLGPIQCKKLQVTKNHLSSVFPAILPIRICNLQAAEIFIKLGPNFVKNLGKTDHSKCHFQINIGQNSAKIFWVLGNNRNILSPNF